MSLIPTFAPGWVIGPPWATTRVCPAVRGLLLIHAAARLVPAARPRGALAGGAQ